MNGYPSIRELFLSFLRLGITAFGGPAMIAHIRELSTEHHQWIDQNDFKNGVALCQAIPGATAMQTAAYVGLRVCGLPGALAAYIGFGLPSFILMLILSIIYVRFHSLPKFISLFNGLQVIVVVVIINAAYSFGRNVVHDYKNIILALLAVIAFWFGVSPFIVIVGAGILGMAFLKVSLPVNTVNSERKQAQWNTRQIIALLVSFLICLTVIYSFNSVLFNLEKFSLNRLFFETRGKCYSCLIIKCYRRRIDRGFKKNC